MKAANYSYVNGRISPVDENRRVDETKCQLVLVFSPKHELEEPKNMRQFQEFFPNAHVVACSTAGQIRGLTVTDTDTQISAFEFEKTQLKTSVVNITSIQGESFEAGKILVSDLKADDLCYILVISDGSLVNGSELVNGIRDQISSSIPVTGGLAGDGTNFKSTLVGLNETPSEGQIIAIGFYGQNLKVSHGSLGGWEMFGPERVVTKSKANQLFEIDGQNALELYKEYLGKYADELPGSALLFPLSVKRDDETDPVVRTILSIEDDTMIFAGDLPEGSKVRFMKANFDRLVDAAIQAAEDSIKEEAKTTPEAALLISCVGRKIILGERIDEEVEAVSDVFGEKTLITGFYSYGEISPLLPNTKCELHNQTMTITTFDER